MLFYFLLTTAIVAILWKLKVIRYIRRKMLCVPSIIQINTKRIINSNRNRSIFDRLWCCSSKMTSNHNTLKRYSLKPDSQQRRTSETVVFRDSFVAGCPSESVRRTSLLNSPPPPRVPDAVKRSSLLHSPSHVIFIPETNTQLKFIWWHRTLNFFPAFEGFGRCVVEMFVNFSSVRSLPTGRTVFHIPLVLIQNKICGFKCSSQYRTVSQEIVYLKHVSFLKSLK